jgi:hypothetical protein
MEFMGVSIGFLALICALVLLFGRHGTRKLLAWSFGLLILGYVTFALWLRATDPLFAPKPTTNVSWQNAPIIAPAPQPAPNNAATTQNYPGSWELAPKPLSDAEVGLAPVQRYPGGWEFDPVTKQWHHNQ